MLWPVSVYSDLGLIESADGKALVWMDALYFSVATWTTIGSGDMHPVGLGKLVAAAHSLMGYFYLAVLISFITRRSG